MPGPELHVRMRTERGVSIALAGEFDVAGRDELDAVLTTELAAGRWSVQLDLAQVTFVDCSVVGVFAAVDARCRAHDSALALVGAQPTVLRVLTLCGLDHLFSTTTFASTPA